MSALAAIGEVYSLETLKSAIAQSTLNREQIKAILVANGLQGELLETTADELANAASINMVAASQKGATTSTLGLGTAFKGLGIAIKKTTASMWTWLTTTPAGWATAAITAIGALIFGLYKLYDAIDISFEEQKEILQETKDSYEEVTNELQELETELQNTKETIKELEEAPNLSWVEQEELKRLREVTKELELQKKLKEEERLKAAENLYKENENAFNKEFTSSYGNTSISDLKDKLSAEDIGIGQLDLRGNVVDIVAVLQHLNEEKKSLTDETEIEKCNDDISVLTESLKANGTDYLTSLSEYKQNILDIANVRELTEDEQAFYDYLTSMQKAIYEFYSPAAWNTIAFGDIFRTKGVEKTKEELIAMYQAGELSPEILESFPKLNEAIKESEIIAGEGSNAFQEVFNEIAALAEKTENGMHSPVSFSNIFSLKSADDTLTTLGQISESIDTIQNAYKTLYDAIEEYNQEGALSVDTLQSVIALGDDWLDYLVDEDGALKLDKQSLEELTASRLNDMRIQAINNVIDNVSKIKDETSASEYLASTNYALADSYEAVAKAKLEDARASMAKAVESGDLSQSSMDKAINKATADIDKINKLFDNTSINPISITGKSGGSGSSSSAAKSDFEETIDFFERRVEILNDSLSLLKSNLENVFGSFARNNLVDAKLEITGEKFANYTDALAMYTQKANEAFSKLPAHIAAKVKDGAVALTDFVGGSNQDVVEAIKDYQSWADKVADCKQELSELQTEIRQLELQKFNNIMKDFSDQFDLRSSSKDLISKQIDLLKETGELIGESFFTSQIDQSKKQLAILENEKTQLVNQLTSALGSGRIQKGTEEWMEMVNALSDVDGNILDCKKSIEEFDNSILELHTEIFNRIQEQFSNLESELSNIFDLFDESEVSDDKGIWSKEGITRLGLLAQQYELAQYRMQQYNNEIDELNAQYLLGKYSAIEYADKLAELSNGQWDAVKAAESAKDAMMDLNETRIENQIQGIEKEIDAYDELTQAQIESLKASKDLHDYEKSIAEKTKSITGLERQLAAMQNDTSAAAVAKKKKLEEQLADAKADLEETEYQHSIETQENTLTTQFKQYEEERNKEIESLRESLNDKENILAESFGTVKDNAALIGQEIATIAANHGVTVSNALISSWQSGENAIASYGTVLSQNTSSFIGNIMGVENEMWNLQAQANTTADTLAWMFSTKADNLVNELTASYYAETNLTNMTNALQQSLVNTLERGYNVSGIINALNNITSAAINTRKVLGDVGLGDDVSPATDVGENIDNIKELNDLKQRKYRLIDLMTGRVYKDRLTYAEALELRKDKNVARHTKIEKYASGTRNAKEGLRLINEDGPELVLPKLSSGNYAIGNAGDQILTKVETDNLFDWSKFNPNDLVPVNTVNFLDGLKMAMPQVMPNNVTNNTPVQISNLVNVQGSINSTDLKQMESIANKAVDKLVNKLHDGITYGR